MAKKLVPTRKATSAVKAAPAKRAIKSNPSPSPQPAPYVSPTVSSRSTLLTGRGDLPALPPSSPSVAQPSLGRTLGGGHGGSVVPTAPGGGGGYSGGGGGGGGGGAHRVAGLAAAPSLSFDDFIKSNFGYNQLRTEQGRQLSEFDNDTLRQRQLTEADQGLKRAALGKALSQMGSDWANDSASRGLLRSGLYLQGQDKVDQAGVTGNQDIDQLLTDLLSERGQGRVSLEQQQRIALNDVLSQLSQQFNKQMGIAA